jgi:hypothetical protein
MRGRIVGRLAILVTFGVLASGGSALAWNGNGNNNGWVNKQTRGCPDDYLPVDASADSWSI